MKIFSPTAKTQRARRRKKEFNLCVLYASALKIIWEAGSAGRPFADINPMSPAGGRLPRSMGAFS
jgi:hypothetical protein